MGLREIVIAVTLSVRQTVQRFLIDSREVSWSNEDVYSTCSKQN